MTLTEHVQKHLANAYQPVKVKSYEVCRLMAMGETTFRRKLRAEGSSYQRLLNNEILARFRRLHHKGYKQYEIDIIPYKYVLYIYTVHYAPIMLELGGVALAFDIIQTRRGLSDWGCGDVREIRAFPAFAFGERPV